MRVALKTNNSRGFFAALFSIFTRWRLHTKFPHAGVVVGEQLMHSTFKGGLRAVDFYPVGWVVFDVPEVADSEALARFEAYKDAPYDVFSLLAFQLPFVFRSSKSLYCFEWVWIALTGENPTVKITPELILARILALRESV